MMPTMRLAYDLPDTAMCACGCLATKAGSEEVARRPAVSILRLGLLQQDHGQWLPAPAGEVALGPAVSILPLGSRKQDHGQWLPARAGEVALGPCNGKYSDDINE